MLNNITIQGRLARDPEAFTTTSGTSGVNFTIANQKRNKEAQFIRCSAFGKTGENIMKYLKKGNMVNVEGELEVASVEDENGERRTYTSIFVRRVHFCGGKKPDDAALITKDEISTDMNPLEEDELPF